MGTYLSPHVTDWTERVQVDGAADDEAAFAAAATAVRAAAEGLVAARRRRGDPVRGAHGRSRSGRFREAGVGALVIEAGLGGRYDATNVLQPGAAVVALTNVALEHTELLGDTEEAIAAEKLAVCADGRGPAGGRPAQPGGARGGGRPSARAATCARCATAPASTRARRPAGWTCETPRALYAGLPLALRGAFQRDNLAVAVAGAEMVLGGAARRRRPLRAAVAGVEMPGRLEVVPRRAGRRPRRRPQPGRDEPRWRGPCRASSPAAGPVVAVVSVLGDKDAAAMVAALATVVDLVVATRSSHARAVAAEELAELARAAGAAAARAVDEPGGGPRGGPRGGRARTGSSWSPAPCTFWPICGRASLAGVREPPARLARARKGTDPTEAK